MQKEWIMVVQIGQAEADAVYKFTGVYSDIFRSMIDLGGGYE